MTNNATSLRVAVTGGSGKVSRQPAAAAVVTPLPPDSGEAMAEGVSFVPQPRAVR